jgi:hypothetical protein
MTKLKDDEAAVVFSPNGMVDLRLPDGENDEFVPKHLVAAACIFVLCTTRADKIQPFVDEIQKEIEGD